MKTFKQILKTIKESEQDPLKHHTEKLLNHLKDLDKVEGSEGRSVWRKKWDSLVNDAESNLNHEQLSSVADSFNAVKPQRDTGEYHPYDKLAHTHEQLAINLRRAGLKEVLDHSRVEQMRKLPAGFQGPY